VPLFLILLLLAWVGNITWQGATAMAGIATSFAVAIVHDQLRRSVIVFTDTTLTIATPDSFPVKRRRWHRSELRAIGYWKGLCIFSENSSESFLRDWDRTELLWVAALLRQAFNVGEEMPPAPGEVTVSYRGALWSNPQNGILAVLPGELHIRHSLSPEPHLIFRADSPTFFKKSGVLYLSPTDIICRLDDSGAAHLDICPADVVCEIRSDGRTCLRVGSLGLLLYERVNLPRDIAEKRILTGDDAQFWLSVWCADPEALPRAVETFLSVRPA
jgi:hypothetical protein